MDNRFGPPTCPACWGRVSCHGGGNKKCVQRDPRPSHIAGIVDTYGGLRVVVAHRKEFKDHVRPDEVLVVVPKPLVHTPINWGDIPMVIKCAEHWVGEWLKTKPNEAHAVEAAVMYKLRCLEHIDSKRSLNLYSIVET